MMIEGHIGTRNPVSEPYMSFIPERCPETGLDIFSCRDQNQNGFSTPSTICFLRYLLSSSRPFSNSHPLQNNMGSLGAAFGPIFRPIFRQLPADVRAFVHSTFICKTSYSHHFRDVSETKFRLSQYSQTYVLAVPITYACVAFGALIYNTLRWDPEQV